MHKSKRIFSVIILIVILSELISCQMNSQRKVKTKQGGVIERKYKGKVKRMIEYYTDNYWINGNALEFDKNNCKVLAIHDFTPEEVPLREIHWWGTSRYPDDPPSQLSVTKVDAFGNIIEETNKTIDGYKRDVRSTYSYNKFGFKTAEAYYDHGNLVNRHEYEYDEFNCEIKHSFFKENNSLMWYCINKYDENNNIISRTQYDADNIINSKTISKYDKDGNLTKDMYYEYDKNGNQTGKSDRSEEDKQYEQMEQKLIAENKVVVKVEDALPYEGYTDVKYYPSGKARSWHYINDANKDIYQIYDEDARIIERKFYRNSQWLETATWKYREDGVLLEESISSSEQRDISYYKTITYYIIDNKGNWMEKYSLGSDGRRSQLSIRVFEYYD